MFSHAPVVFVAHADRSLRSLISAAGWQAQFYDDAETLLAQLHAGGPACLVVDLQLPDIDGLQLQALLADRRDVPLIFVAENPSARTIVRAMKAGAVEMLTTPIDESLLLDAIRQALQLSETICTQQAERRSLQERYDRLSRREREVMSCVVRGQMNKNIAIDLGISEITVKVHRGQVMRKMQADSLADLVSMAISLPVEAPPRPRLTLSSKAETTPCLTH